MKQLTALSDLQKETCRKFNSTYVPCDDYLKVGISKNFDAHNYPINGLRHPLEGNTTGWYLWCGEGFSTDPDFFVALHSVHLKERCPEILKYLALEPGWRFLLAPSQEEVWFDASLLLTNI